MYPSITNFLHYRTNTIRKRKRYSDVNEANNVTKKQYIEEVDEVDESSCRHILNYKTVYCIKSYGQRKEVYKGNHGGIHYYTASKKGKIYKGANQWKFCIIESCDCSNIYEERYTEIVPVFLIKSEVEKCSMISKYVNCHMLYKFN